MTLPGKKSEGQIVALASAGIFALNALLCWPLFRIEYLDAFQSNEGVYITASKFLLESWPHFAWFPWLNGGTPFENAYFPFLEFVTAVLAWLTRWSPAHVFHIVAAVTYSLGPVFLFWFARKVSARLAPALGSGLLWTLISPSSLIPDLHGDMGSWWGSRRLRNLVYYGEAPHIAALSLALLGLWLLVRFWENPGARRFAACAVVFAATLLTNPFGFTVIAISAVMLLGVLEGPRAKWLPLFAAACSAAYLLVCRFLPPSLIRLIQINSPLVGGDFRMTTAGELLGVVFLCAMVALWWFTRRLPNPMLRFAILFAVLFSAITVMGYAGSTTFITLPRRYMVEMDLGVCLLLPFALDPALRKLPKGLATGLAAIALIALAVTIVEDHAFSRRLIRSSNITGSVAFREARWIAANLPDQRVMVSGDNEFWFNLFADNPQLGAGHETMAPNLMRRIAIYTIYTGENLGDRDGPISILWLKAFGCGAITVPGPKSNDYFHPIRNPRKFDGLLPLVWREGDDSIYQVPLKTSSLAHVIPASAVVSRRPVHGGDVDPLRPYISALEDSSLAQATLRWENPERGKIAAQIGAGQVLSVQIAYDRGWRASAGGHPLPVHEDALGMLTIEPKCEGECTIDLEFTGGAERKACAIAGWVTGLVLLAMACWPNTPAAQRFFSR